MLSRPFADQSDFNRRFYNSKVILDAQIEKYFKKGKF